MNRFVALAAALALAGAPLAARAAPPAPNFSQTVRNVKVTDGYTFQSNGGRQVLVSGSQVWVAFGSAVNEPTIARSSDGGLTFPVQVSMVSDPADPADGQSIRIALAKDPLQPGKNLLFAAWTTASGQVLYSYFAERPGQIGWSVPAAIVTSGAEGWTLSVGAAPNGSVHVVYNQPDDTGVSRTFYTTAPSAEGPFPEGAPAPWDGHNSAMAFDLSSNVYMVSTSQDETGVRALQLHRKGPAGQAWTSTQTLLTSAEPLYIGDNVSIAVADPSAIYIAFKRYDASALEPHNVIHLAVTTNGGATWAFWPVTPNAAVYGTHPAIAVSTLNGVRTVTVAAHYVNYGPDGRVTVNKTSDNGLTWSPNANVMSGAIQVSLALDERGKALVSYSAEYLQGEYMTSGDAAFAAGAVDQYRRGIFFSREK